MSLSLTPGQQKDIEKYFEYDERSVPVMYESGRRVKFVVFVPREFSDLVRKAIAEAGGGVIGNYNNCSFTVSGTARFSESGGSIICSVPEDRIETVVLESKLNELIEKVRAVHPYKKMGYDVYPLLSKL